MNSTCLVSLSRKVVARSRVYKWYSSKALSVTGGTAAASLAASAKALAARGTRPG